MDNIVSLYVENLQADLEDKGVLTEVIWTFSDTGEALSFTVKITGRLD